MKVLVLGGAGYIGSVLCQYLKDQGDDVTIFDNLLYENKRSFRAECKFIYGDILNVNDLQPAISEADAVVNLAAISNDPASDLNPELAWLINYKANETIASLCKLSNKKVVLVSSCSVYGFSEKGTFNERSRSNPVTLYARTKMLSEKFYLDEDVNGVILRLATVYGASPKPRFDLVVNTMIGTSFFAGEIIVYGGQQWRPIVHVKDVSRAISLAIHKKSAKSRIYNIGSNSQNYKISMLGKLIAKELPKAKLHIARSNLDTRSYKVDFSLFERDFNFKCEFSIADAVSELYTLFQKKEIVDMSQDQYFRVKYLKKQIKNGNLKKKLTSHNSYFRYEVPA
jgi:nucleoside-diphosphate-sugar epimerase